MSQTSSPQIYALLSKVMADIGAVGKDSKNEQQGYRFRGIDAMLNAVHPAMVKHGVFCVPQVLKTRSTEREAGVTSSGAVKMSFRTVTTMKFIFYAPDGSFVEAITCGEGIDLSDKSQNKAMSAALKYALIQVFSVPTEDMEDGDKTTPETGPAKLPEQATPRVYTRQKSGPDLRTPPPSTSTDKISVDQARSLHIEFRAGLLPELQKDADKHLKDFLTRNKIVNEKGEPSTLAIRKDSIVDVKRAALDYAVGLNNEYSKE